MGSVVDGDQREPPELPPEPPPLEPPEPEPDEPPELEPEELPDPEPEEPPELEPAELPELEPDDPPELEPASGRVLLSSEPPPPWAPPLPQPAQRQAVASANARAVAVIMLRGPVATGVPRVQARHPATIHGLAARCRPPAKTPRQPRCDNRWLAVTTARCHRRRPARAFNATQGPVSGSAKITAVVAARRASYEWQYSTDGGKTWIAAPGTLKASTTVPGLPVGTAVQFRYRALTRAGESDWSQAVVLVVK